MNQFDFEIDLQPENCKHPNIEMQQSSRWELVNRRLRTRMEVNAQAKVPHLLFKAHVLRLVPLVCICDILLELLDA